MIKRKRSVNRIIAPLLITSLALIGLFILMHDNGELDLGDCHNIFYMPKYVTVMDDDFPEGDLRDKLSDDIVIKDSGETEAYRDYDPNVYWLDKLNQKAYERSIIYRYDYHKGWFAGDRDATDSTCQNLVDEPGTMPLLVLAFFILLLYN